MGAVLSFIVLVIIAVTKFVGGAWFIIVLVPVMVAGLMRLNRQYESELEELKEDAPRAAEARVLRRHAVIVLIDQLDVAAARAIQYARALTPDDLRAVHFDLDPIKTEDLAAAWRNLGFSRLPLDIVECSDRRIPNSAAEVVATALADGETEVTVLVPRREYTHIWHRLLHDRTADSIAQALSSLPHCNLTIVPYHLGRRRASEPVPPPANGKNGKSGKNGKTNGRSNGKGNGKTANALRTDCTPIAEAQYRKRVRVMGKVHTVRVQPHSGVGGLECTLVDDTGGIALVFLGRPSIPGMNVGARVIAEGTVGEDHGRLAILNPTYEFLPDLVP
jgi:hypothetical protein